MADFLKLKMNYYYQNQPESKRKKKSNSNLKLILIPIITIGLFLIINNENTSSSTNKIITITEGESLDSILQELKDNKLISSKFTFKRHLTSNNLDSKIQIGSFQIPSNSSNQEIAEIITNIKNANQEKITIPEGYKISQIDQILSEKQLTTSSDFIDCTTNCNINHPLLQYIPEGNSLEGFLFPDTYFINPANFDNQILITTMLDNFENKLPKNWQAKANKLPESDLYSVITMASILEREVLSSQDKAIVAGILWKRYENDWRIDADAALLYEKDDNIITKTDIQSDSPYNLRKFKGLPPTPIANPGLDSIIATLNPIETDYWFYLTTLDTGEVIYAKSNEEHNQNRVKYLQ